MSRVLSLALLSLLALPAPLTAASGTGQLSAALNEVCGQFLSFLPPLSILLVVLGAIFFGAGKLMPNAEFSTRASNMAAGAVVGAVLCLIIVLLVPTILQTIYGGPFSCGTQTWG